MSPGRRDHAVPVRVGEVFGRLTVECEIAPHPHYGKRARYRCACGTRVERVCANVRSDARRARTLQRQTGRRVFGPGCGRSCPLWGRAPVPAVGNRLQGSAPGGNKTPAGEQPHADTHD